MGIKPIPNLHLRRKLKELMPYIQGKRVLDIGCVGEAHNFHSPDWLHGKIEKEAGYCIGMDIQEDMVNQLQDDGYNIVYGDCQEEDAYLPMNFDVIFAGELIEHLPNPGKFLYCASDHLAPGGILILTTPNPYSLYRWLKLFFGDPTASSDHKFWLDITTLSNLLSCYGFKIDSYKLLPTNTFRSLRYDLRRSKSWRETAGILLGLVIEFLKPDWLGKRCIFVVCERG